MPTAPINIVKKSWLMLPKIVNGMASNRFSSFTYNILPPYSPTRFGVSMVILQPANTLLNAVSNENFSKGSMSICHLRASIPQFTHTSAHANHNAGACRLCFICNQRLARSGCCAICLYKLHERMIKINGPKNQLNNIFILLRR